MQRILSMTLLLATLVACERHDPASSAAPATAFQPPTATEVFNLRSRCEELGQKIEDENVIGSALTQSHTSRYNPRTNRCYVQLDVHTADLSKPATYSSTYLFDGQTKELLAWVTSKDGKETNFVVGGPPGRDAALSRIQEVMEDDRKQ
jgi:hypothetical protein